MARFCLRLVLLLAALFARVEALRALASDVLGGAVPMKPGSSRHFVGGCPSFAKGTSATAVAAATAWRAELRALRQMLETAVTAGTELAAGSARSPRAAGEDGGVGGAGGA